MQKRIHSRELKLDLIHQIASGQKQPAQVCREYNLHESLLSRWHREYRERGEAAFLPQQSEQKTYEYLERKRAWDRSYYQRHKIQRQAAAAERKYRLYEYLQRIKAQAKCKYCGENHPAVLQFHHRDPKENVFDVSAFVYHQKGGPAKLQAEIAKCDILWLMANFGEKVRREQQAVIRKLLLKSRRFTALLLFYLDLPNPAMTRIKFAFTVRSLIPERYPLGRSLNQWCLLYGSP